MRILIVEDDAFLAFAIETALSAVGHRIVGFARNETLARELAVAHRPDLALVDLNLARESSGAVVARDLRALGVPSLFVSGSPDECRKVSRELGVLGCLRKPFADEDLIDAVAIARALIAGKRPERVPGNLELYSVDEG